MLAGTLGGYTCTAGQQRHLDRWGTLFVTGYIIRVQVYPNDSDVGEHYWLPGTLSGYTCTRTTSTFRTSGNTGYIIGVTLNGVKPQAPCAGPATSDGGCLAHPQYAVST